MQEMTQERIVDVHYALLPAEIAVFEQAMHLVCSRLGIPKGETTLVYDRAQHQLTQHLRVFYPVVIPDPIPAIEPEPEHTPVVIPDAVPPVAIAEPTPSPDAEPESMPVESSDAVVPSVESEDPPTEDMREGQP